MSENHVRLVLDEKLEQLESQLVFYLLLGTNFLEGEVTAINELRTAVRKLREVYKNGEK